MRTILAMGVSVILSASVAEAGLSLNWNECATAPDATDTTAFACDGSKTPSLLVGSFSVPQDVPGFLGMDLVIEVHAEHAGGVPPFWHYEVGGCNYGGISASAVRPAGSSNCATPWDRGAIALFLGTTFSEAQHAELRVSMARSPGNPVDLTAGVLYYGFQLEFFMDQAAHCGGCTAPILLTWESAILYGANSQIVKLISDSMYPNCASVNAHIDCNDCGHTECPAHNLTWGAIKDLYH